MTDFVFFLAAGNIVFCLIKVKRFFENFFYFFLACFWCAKSGARGIILGKSPLKKRITLGKSPLALASRVKGVI